MISFWRIFWLELVSLVRSKAVALLAGATVLWMLVAPHVLTGDGTAEGARTLYVRAGLGGVFVLVTVALLGAATGTISRERVARRLQLTLVRPVRYLAVTLGKALAQWTVGAAVLALAAAILAFQIGPTRPCRHVYAPVLPTPEAEAETMYASYMDDPETPPAVKRASRAAVLRLLAQRARDHYQTLPTNAVTRWTFAEIPTQAGLAVRLRFTNALDMRQNVRGRLRFGNFTAAVSNLTQTVLTVPLEAAEASAPDDKPGTLSFDNQGRSALMLRPRRDVQILVPADAFAWNLARAWIEMASVLALLIAFGVLLSSGLSRPVALFVAFSALTVSEMGPSVIEQYPDPLEAKLVDRIGLALTRAAAEATHPISALTPLTALSEDECVERDEVARVVLTDALAIPLALLLLAALILARKEDDPLAG